MLSRLICALGLRLLKRPAQVPSRSPSDLQIGEFLAAMREAEEKAWWRGKTTAVAETDQQLLVIKPRGDADPDGLAAIGATLGGWQATRPYARHIWGLDDLLEGRPPRTPPIYLAVPYPCERFEEQYEGVALVFVATGTDRASAAEDLAGCLAAHWGLLAAVQDPDSYSLWNR